MAGSHMKYRKLSRGSAHRQALLRNLVTSLFTHESITTTWPKAKEAQRLAEKLVTLGKRNTEASRRRAHQIFFRPLDMLPRLFGPIRERYLTRPGGYTRVLRTEPRKEDQAPTAVLELVDGPRDMRFALTAQTLARDEMLRREPADYTQKNAEKVTRFRPEGVDQLQDLVDSFKGLETKGQKGVQKVRKESVYQPVRGEGELKDAYLPQEDDSGRKVWKAKEQRFGLG
ncbi:MAG: hypothetical protein M1831_003368 [Alyxoria varia]|nr:MAG: hypothetical protein M1831_003368 [Alyxoria varia]